MPCAHVDDVVKVRMMRIDDTDDDDDIFFATQSVFSGMMKDWNVSILDDVDDGGGDDG